MTTLHQPRRTVKRSRPFGASLSLWIGRAKGRTHYRVTPNVAQDPAVSVAWRLAKADGEVYDVHHDAHGNHCSCADHQFRHEGRDNVGCKHIKALVAYSLLPAPLDAPAPAFDPTVDALGRPWDQRGPFDPWNHLPADAPAELPDADLFDPTSEDRADYRQMLADDPDADYHTLNDGPDWNEFSEWSAALDRHDDRRLTDADVMVATGCIG